MHERKDREERERTEETCGVGRKEIKKSRWPCATFEKLFSASSSAFLLSFVTNFSRSPSRHFLGIRNWMPRLYRLIHDDGRVPLLLLLLPIGLDWRLTDNHTDEFCTNSLRSLSGRLVILITVPDELNFGPQFHDAMCDVPSVVLAVLTRR